jgi:arylsulfatase A-like enzyme
VPRYGAPRPLGLLRTDQTHRRDVRRLLEALKSLCLSENTVVVFVSDHGNHFKTRNDEYKLSPHESSIRVPVVLLGPSFGHRGKVEQLVSLLDLPPAP